MKITNKYGLPGAFVEVAKNDVYSPGESDITVTTLIGPPQIRKLNKDHSTDIECDASEMLWSILGQSVHTMLERAEPSAIVEKRLYMKVLGWKLGGQFDRMTLRKTTLQDYKVSSVWEIIHGLKPERERQLNVLMELAVHNGFPISRLEIVFILRDWQASKAEYDSNYPQVPIVRVPVQVWNQEKRKEYIVERIQLHQAADAGVIYECTDEERWLRGEKWAVMKKGRKSAVKLFDDETKANDYLEDLDSNHSIQHRPGQYVRCERYCPVRTYCKQI